MNITDAIFDHARRRPEHPAVEDGERVVVYSALARLVRRVAGALQARAIRPGDIVVVSLPDVAEHVVVLLAVAQCGAVSLSVDESSPDLEKSKAIEGLGVKAAVVRDEPARFLDRAVISISALFEERRDAEASSGPSSLAADVADSPLMVVQSSGTTGEPKRFFLTHRQMADKNWRQIAMLGLTSDDRYLQVPHLRFFAGRHRCFAMMRLGGTVVLNRANTVAEYDTYFSDHGITYVSLSPFHLRALLTQFAGDGPRWPRLKILTGTAPITPRERLLARQRLTPQLFEAYASNEAGPVALATPADQDRHPDSVGRLIAGIDAQVVDDSGTPLPAGQTGLARFRGPHFPREYLGNAEATARHFRDGWFYPGDLAALSEDGYIFLKGRSDDVINNAGVKYFPAEVEAVLLSHPSVRDAAVIGGPHPQVGEVSVAYVVCSSKVSANELFDFCKGKIAMYKAPQWVFALGELPRTPLGKPDKKSLKETFRRYLETRPPPS